MVTENLVKQIVFADLSIQLQVIRDQIQKTLQRVRLGLAAVEKPVGGKRLAFPDLAFELTMAVWENAPSGTDVHDFRTWILGNGFRELIERVQAHLDWAGSFCRALVLQAKHGIETISTEEEYNQEVDDYWTKIHKIGLKPKMDHLRKEYHISTDLDQAALSAQEVRNCLTHRGGVVSEELDCRDGALQMVWIGPEIEKFSGEGDPKFLKEPNDIGRGGLYLLGSKPQRKTFEAGSMIEIDNREFNDIAVTCYFFCREVTKAAVRYGRDNLGLRDTVAALGDEWSRETAIHLYLNHPEGKSTDAVVVNWSDGRLRLVGVRRMTQEPTEAVTNNDQHDQQGSRSGT
ncbi:MAG: hypothetical protein GY854_21565 [Deltaproteobacteria bacterium]|nr:hypothetical protein [Deltaproteobacteria bacterium]